MARGRTDKLTVEFEVLDADANRKVAEFQANVARANASINTLGANSAGLANFSKNLAATQHQARGLALTLDQLKDKAIGVKGIDGLGKAAARAETEVRSTIARLRELETQAGRTRDPVLLRNIQAEINKTSAGLDRLQNKIDRVAAGRAARPGRGTLNVSGALNSGFGQSALTAGLGAAGIPAAGEAANLLAAVSGAVSGTALVGFGALAAAGAVVVKITKEIRAEAEKRLKVEEAIAAAANKQIIAGKENLKNFAQARADAEFQRQFQRDLISQSVEQLEARRALADRFNQLSPTGPNAERNQQIALDIDAQLDARRQAAAQAQTAGFDQRFKNFQNLQKQAAELEAANERRRIEAINAGQKRVVEFGQTVDELFSKLFAQKGENNPFVAVFTEAERAIESTRVATAALSADLQKTAVDIVTTANANRLFSARLETALQASDLRADAAGIRAGGSGQSQSAFFLELERLKRVRANNPFSILHGGNVNPDSIIMGGTTNPFSLLGGGTNPAVSEFLRRNSVNATVNERLERQLRIVRDSSPANEAQRAEADRKIIALTQGLDPRELSDSQRNAAARARENEATRIEGAEKAAAAARAEQAATQKSIDANIAELLKIARSDGLTGVIRIINDAEEKAGVELGRRPTPRDVTELNEP